MGPKPKGTHSIRLLIRIDAGFAPGCEVTVDFEGVAGAALVGINPVFTYEEPNIIKHLVLCMSGENTKFFAKYKRI